MLKALFRSISWETFVFLVVTTVGFTLTLIRFESSPLKKAARPEIKINWASNQVLGDSGAVDLGCLDQSEQLLSFSNDRTSIRFKGKVCSSSEEGFSKSGLAVRNLSSGSPGMVFVRGNSKQFLTGEIALRPGKNLIQLEWEHDRPAGMKSIIAQIQNE